MTMKSRILVTSLCVAALAIAGSAFAATPIYFLNHNNLPESGTIVNWDGAAAMTSFQGDGVPAAGPTVELVGGQKWAKNYGFDNIGEPWNTAVGGTWGKQTGFNITTAAAPIAVNGATFVTAIRANANGWNTPWSSVIDVMYDKLVLGVRNDTGQIVVKRNGGTDTSAASVTIPSGQSTILSLVCQLDGSYEVFVNGASVMTGGASGDMSSWDPNRLLFADEPDWAGTGIPGGQWDPWWAYVMAAEPTVTAPWDWTNFNALPNRDVYWGYMNNRGFDNSINIGRNQPDGWTAFNGSIGDVLIYGEALSADDRLAAEASVGTAMGIGADVPEPSSMLALASGLVGLVGFGIRRRRS